MKLSLKWLNEYIQVNDISVDDLVYRLTMSGQEVEKVEKIDGDTVIELEVTPNRPDCLSYAGMARELSAVLNRPRQVPQVSFSEIPSEKADITIQDQDGCRRYVGVVIRGVVVRESPQWLQERLRSVGLRPINNIVDITNFCLMETGHPLHAFDYDLLTQNKIIVRRAKEGETIRAINGTTYSLNPETVVIADAEQPVAIAGIMGGQETEVSEGTKNILLESAYFNSVLVRRASRKMALSSDASYRFERGIDFEGVRYGALRAVDLILELAGGTVSAFEDAQAQGHQVAAQPICVTISEIASRIGLEVSEQTCVRILRQLDFHVEQQETVLRLVPPSFRADVKRKEDVIEEIARVVGFDNLPETQPRVVFSSIQTNSNWTARKKVRRLLTAQGFYETLTFSMVSEKQLGAVGYAGSQNDVRIVNPLSQEQEVMRPVMLPSLLAVAAINFNKGQKNLRLFEIGKIYRKNIEVQDAPDLEEEKIVVLVAGVDKSDWRRKEKVPQNIYDVKGAMEVLLGKAMRVVPFAQEEAASRNVEQGCAGWIYQKQECVGFAGKICEEALVKSGIKEKDVYYGEVDAKRVYQYLDGFKKFIPLDVFPSIIRDVSLELAREISYQDVKGAIEKESVAFLRGVDFVDEYIGKNIGAGKKSLTVSLTFRADDRTLTEEEIAPHFETVIASVLEKFRAQRR